MLIRKGKMLAHADDALNAMLGANRTKCEFRVSQLSEELLS